MTAQPDQDPSHLRNVLQEVLRWRLNVDGWAEISAILDNLKAALRRADSDRLAALAEASVALELSAPERLTEIDKLTAPVPDRVRERVNVLIHELTPSAGPGTDEASGAAG